MSKVLLKQYQTLILSYIYASNYDALEERLLNAYLRNDKEFIKAFKIIEEKYLPHLKSLRHKVLARLGRTKTKIHVDNSRFESIYEDYEVVGQDFEVIESDSERIDNDVEVINEEYVGKKKLRKIFGDLL